MKKVATPNLAIAIDDYYESGGSRYVLKALSPKQFSKEAVIQESRRTIHNFGVTTPIALVASTDNGTEVHLEGGANYTIAATDWDDGQSITFLHTAGQKTTETLTVRGFAKAYYRDGKTTEITSSLSLGAIVDAQYQATVTNNGGNKYLNIWMTNDGITGTAGIVYSYPNATARLAGTGYAPTADDVSEANLFLQLDANTLWRATTVNPLAWAQISAPPIPVNANEAITYSANGSLQSKSHRALLLAGAETMALPAGDPQVTISIAWVSGTKAPVITANGTEKITGTAANGTDFDEASISLSEKGRSVSLVGKSGGYYSIIGG